MHSDIYCDLVIFLLLPIFIELKLFLCFLIDVLREFSNNFQIWRMVANSNHHSFKCYSDYFFID